MIADEPTTALDVTIQAQILDLLARLQAERRMGMLLITHDLGVVARMAQRVGVMYAGEIVEQAPRDAFFARPRHPYTLKLFAALPDLSRRGGRLETIAGQVPALAAMPTGCRFAARCPQAFERCRVESPGWSDCGEGHRVRCHWIDEGRECGGEGDAGLLIRHEEVSISVRAEPVEARPPFNKFRANGLQTLPRRINSDSSLEGPATTRRDHQAASGNLLGRIRLSAGIPNLSCKFQIIVSVRGRLRLSIS